MLFVRWINICSYGVDLLLMALSKKTKKIIKSTKKLFDAMKLGMFKLCGTHVRHYPIICLVLTICIYLVTGSRCWKIKTNKKKETVFSRNLKIDILVFFVRICRLSSVYWHLEYINKKRNNLSALQKYWNFVCGIAHSRWIVMNKKITYIWWCKSHFLLVFIFANFSRQ